MRKFKCIGQKETEYKWKHHFDIDKIYEEHRYSWPVLMLDKGDGTSVFVDEDQFEEVKEELEITPKN